MKKVLIAMCLVAAWASLAMGQPADATAAKKGSIYLDAGISMPMSPDGFKDNFGNGFGGGAGLGYMFTPSVEGVAMFDYSTFSADLSGVDDATFTEFTGNVKYIFGAANAASKFKPFLTVGIGMTSIDFGGTSESNMVLLGGGGVDMWVSPKVAIFGEVKYATVSSDPESTGYLPIRVGAKIPVF